MPALRRRVAAALGAVYVGLRALYPFLLGRSIPGTQPKRVVAVTGPCYAIVAYLGGHVLWAALS